jgi:hypothetical protein
LALKKNRCGTAPVSKMSDNEHATATLGNSKVLSVKHSPCEAVSAFDPRDDSAVLPPFGWGDDVTSGEDSQKARKISSSFA